MAKHTPPRARNAGAAGLSSPLWFFPAVPSCLTGNFTVRSDAHTREVVRRRMSPTNAAGSLLTVFLFSVPLPSAHHQFRVAAMAVSSAFGTHTNTCNRGPSPLLHLSVTVLDVPPCRRRESQCTGARVSVEPSTPSSNLFATLTPNTASPKSVHILSLFRRRAHAVGFVSPPWPRCDVRTNASTYTRGVEPLCSPRPTAHIPVRTLTLDLYTYSCDPHRHRTRVCVGEPHLAALCRRREPQRVGTRLFPEAIRCEVDPSWPP
jgi:hypothetical protein